MSSLRQRLQLSLSLTLLLMLILFAIGTGFMGERLMHELVASRLADDSEALLAKLQWQADTPGLIDVHSLSASYQRAYSGHYYILQTDGLQQQSRSLWDQTFLLQQAADTGGMRLYETTGPLQQQLLVRVAHYEKRGRSVVIWLAEDMSPHYAPLQSFYISFALASTLLLLFLWWLQRSSLRREFSSLDRVAAAISRMKHGELERLSEQVPDEIAPLVLEVNHLAAQLEKRIERSRHAIGNVAHALKTPLSLLQQQAEDPLWSDFPKQHEHFKHQLLQIKLRVDDELRRGRIMGASHPVESFNPAMQVPSLIETVKRVHYERDVDMQCDCVEQSINGISRDDMLELLGNLLENAYKWAKTQVVCVIEADTDLKIRIDDDGVGTEQAEQLLATRGQRLDEQQSGHGLGLAICQEIVAAYGGTLVLGRSTDLGGFRVSIELPLPSG